MTASDPLSPQPPWARADSIGHAAWQRLSHPGISTPSPGLSLIVGPTSVHDRHMSFVDSLLVSSSLRDRSSGGGAGDDPRVFRRAVAGADAWSHAQSARQTTARAVAVPAPAARFDAADRPAEGAIAAAAGARSASERPAPGRAVFAAADVARSVDAPAAGAPTPAAPAAAPASSATGASVTPSGTAQTRPPGAPPRPAAALSPDTVSLAPEAGVAIPHALVPGPVPVPVPVADRPWTSIRRHALAPATGSTLGEAPVAAVAPTGEPAMERAPATNPRTAAPIGPAVAHDSAGMAETSFVMRRDALLLGSAPASTAPTGSVPGRPTSPGPAAHAVSIPSSPMSSHLPVREPSSTTVHRLQAAGAPARTPVAAAIARRYPAPEPPAGGPAGEFTWRDAPTPGRLGSVFRAPHGDAGDTGVAARAASASARKAPATGAVAGDSGLPDVERLLPGAPASTGAGPPASVAARSTIAAPAQTAEPVVVHAVMPQRADVAMPLAAAAESRMPTDSDAADRALAAAPAAVVVSPGAAAGVHVSSASSVQGGSAAQSVALAPAASAFPPRFDAQPAPAADLAAPPIAAAAPRSGAAARAVPAVSAASPGHAAPPLMHRKSHDTPAPGRPDPVSVRPAAASAPSLEPGSGVHAARAFVLPTAARGPGGSRPAASPATGETPRGVARTHAAAIDLLRAGPPAPLPAMPAAEAAPAQVTLPLLRPAVAAAAGAGLDLAVSSSADLRVAAPVVHLFAPPSRDPGLALGATPDAGAPAVPVDAAAPGHPPVAMLMATGASVTAGIARAPARDGGDPAASGFADVTPDPAVHETPPAAPPLGVARAVLSPAATAGAGAGPGATASERVVRENARVYARAATMVSRRPSIGAAPLLSTAQAAAVTIGVGTVSRRIDPEIAALPVVPARRAAGSDRGDYAIGADASPLADGTAATVAADATSTPPGVGDGGARPLAPWPAGPAGHTSRPAVQRAASQAPPSLGMPLARLAAAAEGGSGADRVSRSATSPAASLPALHSEATPLLAEPIADPSRSTVRHPDPPPDAGASRADIDVDDLVERAWRALMSRLAIEQERRGFARWA